MKNIKEEWDDDIIYTPLQLYEARLDYNLIDNLRNKLYYKLFDELKIEFVFNLREEVLFNEIQKT